jgi:hypothetical protein
MVLENGPEIESQDNIVELFSSFKLFGFTKLIATFSGRI